MKIKRFFAKDMRTALAEVKETLGPDAVIMSNKKVSGGIEIVAAVDYQNQALFNVHERDLLLVLRVFAEAFDQLVQFIDEG